MFQPSLLWRKMIFLILKRRTLGSMSKGCSFQMILMGNWYQCFFLFLFDFRLISCSAWLFLISSITLIWSCCCLVFYTGLVPKIFELCERCSRLSWPSTQCFTGDTSRKSHSKYFLFLFYWSRHCLSYFLFISDTICLLSLKVRIMRKRLVRKAFDMILGISMSENRDVINAFH